jgi:peptidyl-prolyl cis-trans isomerase SurA
MERLLTLLLGIAGALPGAVVIDRIAVVVNKHAIKSSDIQRDLRLTEFINGEPVNLGAAEMRKSAERLIDQTLIRDEIARGGYQRPSDADAESLTAHLVRDRFGASDARLREALARYGLREDELRAQFLLQLTVLRFIDQRFRPGVQVTDEDVRTYYEQHLAELKRKYPASNSLDALRTQIRASLEGERINEAFAAWIGDARKQAHIEYREGAFE